jgi:hypothetical protein
VYTVAASPHEVSTHPDVKNPVLYLPWQELIIVFESVIVHFNGATEALCRCSTDFHKHYVVDVYKSTN